MRYFLSIITIFTLSLFACETPQKITPEWPEINTETKPWTRWWWHGSAVTREGITSELEGFKKAGLGGVEITPIFGVMGEEDKFIDFLTPEWTEMLIHTLKEAKRLGLGVDMATGTGWPFGGPWIDEKEACKYIDYKQYHLKEGESLNEPLTMEQEPILRLAGRNKVTIDQIKYPVSSNENMQELAIDQVRLRKPLNLVAMMAYSDKGEIIDLTSKVDENNRLDWTAPVGNWSLYAVFQGWHGKMVERAAPGGEGNVIDHFSKEALHAYFSKFDSAFKNQDISSLRAFFNDSYEVDDARGEANWTPGLFDEFKRLRGYDVKEYLPALFAKKDFEDTLLAERVLCDFRETIGDLLYENFTSEWHRWAQDKNAIIRNQSHGSPANILDLYAVADIPETEGDEILKIKFASSAANVNGKKLSSSESATWLNEHFLSGLSDVKTNIDRYILGGVNHVFYHGTAYSPNNEAWPGRLFYAAIHANDRNPWWDDFSTLNQYIARVQSFMQSGKPDNDILLYFPVYDRFSEPGRGLLEHFDIRGNFYKSEVKKIGEELWDKGFTFDFISDKQIKALTLEGNQLVTGGVKYKTVLVPSCKYIPLETLRKLKELADQGATIVFDKQLPGDVPGLGNLAERQKAFQELIKQIQQNIDAQGTIKVGEDLSAILASVGIKRETLLDSGLKFNRKSFDKGYYYFVTNWSDKKIDGFVPLSRDFVSAVIFNPMTGEKGLAKTKIGGEGNLVYLQLSPGESFVLVTYNNEIDTESYPIYEENGDPQEITGAWKVEFIKGGEQMPEPQTITDLNSWTEFASEAGMKFSGTASYKISFEKPKGDAQAWVLDLGEVHQSAKVKINDKEIGTLIGPSYSVNIYGKDLKELNELEIEVSNLMANRIIDLDKRGVQWKKFYNVNFPARKPENSKDGLFDASGWEPLPSGLMGPVTLTPLSVQ